MSRLVAHPDACPLAGIGGQGRNAAAPVLSLHDRLCDQPPSDNARACVAHLKALSPEDAADLLAELVDLKRTLRLLLEEQDV